MDDELVERSVRVIRDAYAHLPKNDAAVDAMIAQGLRTGFSRGKRAAIDEKARDYQPYE